MLPWRRRDEDKPASQRASRSPETPNSHEIIPRSGRLGDALGSAVRTKDGWVIVADSRNGRLIKLDPCRPGRSKVIAQMARGNFPNALALLSNGDLVVTFRATNEVPGHFRIFHSCDGQTHRMGEELGKVMRNNRAMTTDEKDQILILESAGKNAGASKRVGIFNRQGVVKDLLNLDFAEFPSDLVAAKGIIYIADNVDAAHHCVHRLTEGNGRLPSIGRVEYVARIHMDSWGHLVVVGKHRNLTVTFLDAKDGRILRRLTSEKPDANILAARLLNDGQMLMTFEDGRVTVFDLV